MTRRIGRRPILCGQGGLNASRSISQEDFPEEDLEIAENITTENGTWRKVGGSAKVNTTQISGNPRVVGVHDFTSSGGTQSLVAATGDGKIVTVVVGGIGATLKTGLGTDKLSVFVEGGGGTTKLLFHTNGNSVVQTWDGVAATTSDITTPPADWTGTNQPTGLGLHGGKAGTSVGRLVGWGNANDPNRIYLSVPSNHQDFTSAGFAQLPIFPGFSNRLSAGISWKGLWVWFKDPVGIGWIDTSGSVTDTTTWQNKLGNTHVGTGSARSVIMADNQIFFMGTDGLVYTITGIQEFGELAVTAVMPMKLLRWAQEHIDLTYLNRCVGEYYPAKKQIIWAVRQVGSGSTTNDAQLVLDLHKPDVPSFFWITKDVAIDSMALRRISGGIQRPMIGDATGTVWMTDQDARSVDASGYTGAFSTRMIVLDPDRHRRMNLHYLEALIRNSGNWNLSVDVELDGVYSETVQFPLLAPGSFVLGTGVLDTDTLGGDMMTHRQERITGSARHLKLTGYNAGAGQDFEAVEFYVGITEGSDDI